MQVRKKPPFLVGNYMIKINKKKKFPKKLCFDVIMTSQSREFRLFSSFLANFHLQDDLYSKRIEYDGK